ncbi:helix-turn-helix domain-containing protein [Haladaptatus halobius]|uniref:helix-turn-helix domain-containing protein n=1 Tax=Haladaptatus halobius TaxID=2884875 RepID=UPI001D0A3E67|nr:helix-turn-helix domain-containing protein [Haladaptatus halobius]
MREAIIHIPHAEYETVGLGEIISLIREAGLRDITELACESEGCLVVITVAAPMAEDELGAIDYLEWWERLSDGGNQVVYLFKISFSGFDEDIQPMLTSDVSSDEIRVDDNGIDVALVGSQEDIAQEINEYGDAGMTVLLERIADYGGPKNTLDALTDRQREILQTAYELGYFDVPRSGSTADVADTLELDPSTVAEHLQRAERNLMANLLTPP